ncbi:MAG: IS30 family transposase [Clostridium sp.]|jgi:IS30 family transposase|nr:IS30 family transposase [Clostridium sp.]
MSQINYNNKRKKGKHLNFRDRQLIDYYATKFSPKMPSVYDLVELIGASESTIRRELKRGQVKFVDTYLKPYISYSAELAQQNADFQSSGKGPELKINKDHKLMLYIENQIVENKMSPDAVIMKLDQNGWKDDLGEEFETKICTKTIYNYIDKDMFMKLTNKDLPRRGLKKKKQRYIRRSHRKRDGKSILERPKSADIRSEYGHWEMDCIEGAKGREKACILTLVERKTRESLVLKLSAQTQRCVINSLNKIEKRLGRDEFKETFKTITVDNGSEFLNDLEMEQSIFCEKSKRTNIYYAHPYCSWERGSNEHVNGMIRRFIPKGSFISPVQDIIIQKIETWLNNYPRRLFNGLSAFQYKLKVA